MNASFALAIEPAAGAPEVPPDANRIDARGGTIMPGLVEAHFHPTYFNVASLEGLAATYAVKPLPDRAKRSHSESRS